MQTLTAELGNWLMQYKGSAWFVLFGWVAVQIIYGWLVRASPAGAIGSVMNARRNRLRALLEQPFVSEEARALAERELRQKSLHQLTGLLQWRLQDLAVAFITRNGERARYLAPWRSWLGERDGQITFNRKWYRRAWWCFVLMTLPISLMMLALMTLMTAQQFGYEYTGPILLANTVVWWFPWLFFTRVPVPPVTRILESRLAAFNAERAGIPAEKATDQPD
ncbi:hypothetical protein [Type-D symbiont of Plautia stali]|uniref:hypothetical protein n=1 Tax=Type-D symbiont of Plautia stali TaxID=1560356 RepID=UPI00073F791E|nr:hypothetical protein [Type-D symbiont of Plautia stali]